MLLAVDIGNTTTVIGVFQDETLRQNWRLSTRLEATGDELGALLRGLLTGSDLTMAQVDHVIVSSVVPVLNQAISQMSRKHFGVEPLIVGPGIRTGIQIRTDDPKEVGADRIVNGLAAFRKYGGPAVVIDFGTATTFDAVAANGDYLGGAIAPGINISMEALFSRASKLPRVDLAVPRGVEAAIGKNTIESMQAGFIFGFAGQIEGIVERMRTELGGSCRVIATGGLANLIAPHAGSIEVVDENLTLEGLRIIHELNAGSD